MVKVLEVRRRPLGRITMRVESFVVEIAHEGAPTSSPGKASCWPPAQWPPFWIRHDRGESTAMFEVEACAEVAGTGRGRVKVSGGRRDGMAQARQALARPSPPPPQN